MSDEHLTELQLDELAAGLTPPGDHLPGCGACLARLDARRAENAAFLAQPKARAQLAALTPAQPARRVAPWVGLGLAIAAGLTLLFVWPKGEDTRLKGAPAIMLLDARDTAVSHAPVGARLTLAAGGAGFTHVTVTARSADGSTAVLFDGPLAPGARVPLSTLEVTPGDVDVTADFSDGARHQTASTRLQVP